MRLRASPAKTSGGMVAELVEHRLERVGVGPVGLLRGRRARATSRVSTRCRTGAVVIGRSAAGYRYPPGAPPGMPAPCAASSAAPPAHLLELLLGHRLLREQRRLDAVEQPLEPADELGLREPQLGLARRVGGEREHDVFELGAAGRARGCPRAPGATSRGSRAARRRPASSSGARRTSSSIVAHHRRDADQLRRPGDLLAVGARSPRRRRPPSTTSGCDELAARVGPRPGRGEVGHDGPVSVDRPRHQDREPAGRAAHLFPGSGPWLSPRRATAGPGPRRRRPRPGTSWNRYGSASRPGWQTQHSPVRPPSRSRSTASAIWLGRISGKSAARNSALASSLRMLVSVIPGFTVLAVMPYAARGSARRCG